MFKLWSETNKEIEFQLKPNLGLRNWNDLKADEKYKIWKFIEEYLFDFDNKQYDSRTEQKEFTFKRVDIYLNENVIKGFIVESIQELNERYKHKSFGENFLKCPNLRNACNDFYNIFVNKDEGILLELFSLYAKALIDWSLNHNRFLPKKENEIESDFNLRFLNYQYIYFDAFCRRLNEVFEDFGLNILLTRQGFIPRQGERIIEEIYKPTLDFLSDSKYNDVNREFLDALEDYHRKDFSGCVTKTVSTIQAFLQISINGEIGKGDISKLIPQAIKEKLIPDDIFTKTIFDNLESIIARERQETADSHPKIEYANERNARLILNIAMVFIQHFIQLQK